TGFPGVGRLRLADGPMPEGHVGGSCAAAELTGAKVDPRGVPNLGSTTAGRARKSMNLLASVLGVASDAAGSAVRMVMMALITRGAGMLDRLANMPDQKRTRHYTKS